MKFFDPHTPKGLEHLTIFLVLLPGAVVLLTLMAWTIWSIF